MYMPKHKKTHDKKCFINNHDLHDKNIIVNNFSI